MLDLRALHAEGKRLYEEASMSYDGAAPFEVHGCTKETGALVDWIEENFPTVLGWLAQEPMAHQLADADQALHELEEDQRRFDWPIGQHLQRLRTAIDGTEYQR